MREEFKLGSEENGASIIGNPIIKGTTRSGEPRRIHCEDNVGDTGHQIPPRVEQDKVKLKSCDADFALAIETRGMFDRLVENRFDEKWRAVLIHLTEQFTRSTENLSRD
jgi:DNA topoisomerase-6 subunit A